jgi:hypothetical protein
MNSALKIEPENVLAAAPTCSVRETPPDRVLELMKLVDLQGQMKLCFARRV